jgi:hypothetical protein
LLFVLMLQRIPVQLHSFDAKKNQSINNCITIGIQMAMSETRDEFHCLSNS